MLAVFVLFLKANFGWEAGTAGAVYSSFLALVYLLPLFGGMLADKIGYSRCVTTGIIVMFLATPCSPYQPEQAHWPQPSCSAPSS